MNNNRLILLAISVLGLAAGCGNSQPEIKSAPFAWNNATVYFLLTDRFCNGDTTNDVNFNRTEEAAKFRGFMGGDLQGIVQKLESGYFDDLGVNAIWFTPVFEQIHGSVDEGTGNTYGFHGYWAKDWTRLDPNFGTFEELEQLVKLAHSKGIRILMDVVINHRGPVTALDPNFDTSWVRTTPQCTYQDSKTTIPCALVENLPDVRTESNSDVLLPDELVDKFKREGRYEQEMAELEAFFKTNGKPRAPRFYIMKWLTDLVRKYGVDGFRVDTAKHTEENVWSELAQLAQQAFEDWKHTHTQEVLDTNRFFMLGEVYNYSIDGAQLFDFGDRKVNYYANGFNSLVNFGFKSHVQQPYETLFSSYDSILQRHMNGHTVLNYLTSHDDGWPYDKKREKPFEAGTRLLLAPGMAQIYYGDETARRLDYPDAAGDATLRSFMNWEEINDTANRNGYRVKDVLGHYQKLGTFRKSHPAVGCGTHTLISSSASYIFKRVYEQAGYTDQVVVGLDLKKGNKQIPVAGVFSDGQRIYDYYSNQQVQVKNGLAVIDSEFDIVLLGIKN